MGCSASLGGSNTSRPTSSFLLSPVQKSLIRETWETIQLHRFSVGKGTFLRFFDANPEYQKLFPEFRDVKREDLCKTSALYGHAKRVIRAVEDTVTAIDDIERVSSYLEELGQRHQTRSLKPVYLDAMQVAFMAALKDLLQREWTSATEEAWNQLFRFICCIMVKGLQRQ